MVYTRSVVGSRTLQWASVGRTRHAFKVGESCDVQLAVHLSTVCAPPPNEPCAHSREGRAPAGLTIRAARVIQAASHQIPIGG